MSNPAAFRTDWVLDGAIVASTLDLYPCTFGSALTLPLTEPHASRYGSHLILVRVVGYDDRGEQTGCFIGDAALVRIARTVTVERWNGRSQHSDPGL